jgi:Protein of unknown function (DUF998)
VGLGQHPVFNMVPIHLIFGLGRVRDVRVRAGAVAGIVGPAAFTGAWIVGSLRQTGHPAAVLQISGLAAADARDPWIMTAGFVVLGGCTVVFGAALHDALGGRGRGGPAPRLIQGAGLLTIAAGLLKRDHMLLTGGDVSWHNHAHDVISAVIYADLVLAQMLLAARFGGDPRWRAWRPWLAASAGVTGALLIAFAAATSAPAAGILQRAAVTVPLAALTAMAVRLARAPREASRDSVRIRAGTRTGLAGHPRG